MARRTAALDRGLAEFIGVSNVGRDRLARARGLSDGPAITDQMLFHPWSPQRDLRRYCQEADDRLTASRPLAYGAISAIQSWRTSACAPTSRHPVGGPA